MPAFDFAPLVWWGLPLVAAPVLIHLINLLRHRRVRWAAMELLVASQKKYKTRILLRQLLLLALRTAAVAGIVLALAQPRWRSALGNVNITVRGTSYPALYAGPAGAYYGLDQLNIGPLPASLVGAGEVDIALTVDGKPANTVKINFK